MTNSQLLHPNAERRFENLDRAMDVDEYNFESFTTPVLLADAARTIRSDGICAGELAPDFELEKAVGGTVRLSEFRGRPVLLHFGSYS